MTDIDRLKRATMQLCTVDGEHVGTCAVVGNRIVTVKHVIDALLQH
jgi:hypothetical protein